MLDLFTVVWGNMANSFLEVTLPSLMQRGNIPAGKALLHSYNFYASEGAKGKIMEHGLYSKLGQEVEVNWFPLQKGVWETTSNTLYQMKLSAKEGHYMLIMAPDNAVGNSSILNMAKLCDGQHNPILFGFPRVNDQGWEGLKELYKEGEPVSNRKLVTLAMNYIEQATYSIEKKVTRWIVQGNAWAVRHNVPTPCILPDEKIIEIFLTNPTRNSGYDHILPFWMVELGYPWHLIRHSEIYFQAERGRHLINEGIGIDTKAWNLEKQMRGVEFFGKEEAGWQGI